MTNRFKIDFSCVPESILREKDNRKYIVLLIPTLKGRVRYELFDGDEIEPVDTIMEHSLQGFEFPKIPIHRMRKSEDNFNPVYYSDSCVRGLKPFGKVVSNG